MTGFGDCLTRDDSPAFLCQLPAELRTDYKEDKAGTVFRLISLSVPHVKTADQGNVEECEVRLEGGRDEEQKISREMSVRTRPTLKASSFRKCNVI